VEIHAINEDFNKILTIEIAKGRYFTESEFQEGINTCVIGNEITEKLFGSAEIGVDKFIEVRGKKLLVVGIVKKQGGGALGGGGWQFDKTILITYRFGRNILNELKADPLIMVQGPPGLSSKGLKDELSGTMRALRKLSPTQEDNFALNDINDFSDAVSSIFSNINMGGWAIAILSLIVGMFGVANIMFVSVRERTPQIGLKKAIGAKKSVILTEFLLESSFLCIIGGLIGLTLVFILTKILTVVVHFPFFISIDNMLLAIGICIVVGILAGFIPAKQAANMDPVVAIRSK
jgi:putative ABC transport system permease protein